MPAGNSAKPPPICVSKASKLHRDPLRIVASSSHPPVEFSMRYAFLARPVDSSSAVMLSVHA